MKSDKEMIDELREKGETMFKGLRIVHIQEDHQTHLEVFENDTPLKINQFGQRKDFASPLIVIKDKINDYLKKNE